MYTSLISQRDDFRLPAKLARLILNQHGIAVSGSVHVRRIPSGNAVFRVAAGSDTYFVKVPTKDLGHWTEPLDGASRKVTREWAAHRCLRKHGRPSVEVIGFDPDPLNPLGRPYLVTRKLEGKPFTAVLPPRARRRWSGPLEAVGAFLASVHEIELDGRGFIDSPDGPGTPDPAEPARGSHHPEVEQAEAMRDLMAARPFLDAGLAASLEERLGRIATEIASEYVPPRFVLGAFHPNHPFLAPTGRDWVVTGCVDLEVASGGRATDDLVTFAVGVMLHFEHGIPWWEPFFAGYGCEPDLERLRTALLSSCWYCFGELAGAHRIAAVYQALLAARSWGDLFTAHRALG